MPIKLQSLDRLIRITYFIFFISNNQDTVVQIAYRDAATAVDSQLEPIESVPRNVAAAISQLELQKDSQ